MTVIRLAMEHVMYMCDTMIHLVLLSMSTGGYEYESDNGSGNGIRPIGGVTLTQYSARQVHSSGVVKTLSGWRNQIARSSTSEDIVSKARSYSFAMLGHATTLQ